MEKIFNLTARDQAITVVNLQSSVNSMNKLQASRYISQDNLVSLKVDKFPKQQNFPDNCSLA